MSTYFMPPYQFLFAFISGPSLDTRQEPNETCVMSTQQKPKKGSPAPEAASLTMVNAPTPKHSEANIQTALTVYGDNPYELVMPETLHELDYLAYGARIGKAIECGQWRIGDYVNFGFAKFGYKDYTKIAGVTNLDPGYLRVASSVAGRVPPNMRDGYSLEKFRLMLGRKGAKETLPKLIKRLGQRTNAELRAMSISHAPTCSAAKLLTLMVDLVDKLVTFDRDKLFVLLSQDHAMTTIEALRANLDAIVDAAPDILDTTATLPTTDDIL